MVENPGLRAAGGYERGVEEIISRIRKITRAWVFNTLSAISDIGIGIWQDLSFKYL